MKRIATFSIFRHEQPDDAAWAEARRLASRPAWSVVADAILRATAEVGSPEYRALRDELDALQAKANVVSLEDVEEFLDEADRAAGQFAWILGVRLDGLRGDFTVSGDRGPPAECPRCGNAGPWSAPQDGVYTVRDELLDGPAAIGDEVLPPVPGGWDFVNLPYGLLVSTRVRDWFAEWNVEGAQTRPVLSAASGEPSKRACQLVASIFLPAVCVAHSGKEVTVCPACGVVLEGALGETWSVRSTEVKGRALWSRDPQRVGELFLARSIIDRLRERDTHGLITEKSVQVCDH